MTEPEVIEKLTSFKEKLLKFRDERNGARETLASLQTEYDSLKSLVDEKEETIKSLMSEKSQAMGSIDTIQQSIDNLQSQYDLKTKEIESLTLSNQEKDVLYADLKEKTYHTVKHLVEDIIEVQEKTIDSLNFRVTELESIISNSDEDIDDFKSEIDEKNTEIESLRKDINAATSLLEEKTAKIAEYESSLNDPAKYIKIEEHKAEIERLLEEKKQSDHDKDTVLSNTWKTQVETSKQLTEKAQQLEFIQEELRNSKSDVESLKTALDDKTKELDDYKELTSGKIKELENANKRIDDDNKLSITRLTDKVNSLMQVRDELTLTNTELREKIKILEDRLKAQNTSTVSKTDTVERNVVSKDTIPYRFGSTTPLIMQKAKDFIEELYNGSSFDGSAYVLNNPQTSADIVGLSKKEYEVFMNRLSECLEYDGCPLLYQHDSHWKSNLTKMKLIDFISSIS